MTDRGASADARPSAPTPASASDGPQGSVAAEGRHLNKRILAAGALASAVASVLGVGATVGSWFRGQPAGSIESASLAGVRPLTYGEWLEHENLDPSAFPASERRTPGRLVAFDIETKGFESTARLPVRIRLHNVTRQSSRRLVADTLRIDHGDSCGCFEWVPMPRGRDRYYLEIAIYPPGPIRGQPVKSLTTDEFRVSEPLP